MNRTLGFVAAILFAVAGVALVGGEQSVEAGWGCHGGGNGCHGGMRARRAKHCGGGVADCGGDVAVNDCGGCAGSGHGCHGGLLARWRARRCSGAVADCGGASAGCGGAVDCGGGEVAPHSSDAPSAEPPVPPAPDDSASVRPVITRVAFVR